MSLNRRLLVMLTVPILALGILFGIGTWAMHGAEDSLDRVEAVIVDDISPLLKDEILPLINEDLTRIRNLDLSMELMLEADRDMHQALIAERAVLASILDLEQFAAEDQTNAENIDQALGRVNRASEFFMTPDTQGTYSAWQTAFAQWKQSTRGVLARAGDEATRAEAHEISKGTATEHFDKTRGLLDQLQELQQEQIQLTLAAIEERKAHIGEMRVKTDQRIGDAIGMCDKARDRNSLASTVFLSVGIAGVVVAILIGATVSRRVCKVLRRVSIDLLSSANQINTGSEQIANGSERLAVSTTEQSSALEETTSALDQVSAMTKTNAENAREVNGLSSQARTAAEQGGEIMVRLNEAMTAINQSSGRISNIIKVIEEIAFQTNLLALNAAVEAARAGEHGKGFAVVAEEVRNLAQRAAEAAGQTTGLIEDSVRKAKEGADVAADVGQSLSTIVTDISKVTDLIEGITVSSQEQADGVNQVNVAMNEMNKTTQQNAAGAEESSSAAKDLSSQVAIVKRMVDDLAEVVEGAKGTRSASSKRAQARIRQSSATPVLSQPSQKTPASTSSLSDNETPHSPPDPFLELDDSDAKLAEF